MAEEPTPPAEPAEPPVEPKAVPYERFQQVNEQHKQLKQQLNEVQAKLREREEAEMSASERERLARERAEQRVTELEGELTRVERGSLVTAEARKAGFADPEDALGFVDPTTIETEAQARRAVKDLAERKPHLLDTRPEPPELGQVLRNGELTDPSKPGTAESLHKQLDAEMRRLAGFSSE